MSTTHYYVYDLDAQLKPQGAGAHYAASDALTIAWVAKTMRKPGDCYLVTDSSAVDPLRGRVARYRLTAHGPVEIDERGELTTPHQVPLILEAAAPGGSGIAAHAFGNWYYDVDVVKHTRTRVQLVVRTGSSTRPPKFYNPGPRSLVTQAWLNAQQAAGKAA